MTFWIITGALALTVSVLLAIALRDRGEAVRSAEYDLRVYRDQLREVDRDLVRGVVSGADAIRVRTEISRRILSADAALQETAKAATSSSAPRIVVAAIVLGVIGLSFALYLRLGAPGYGDLALQDRIRQAETLRAERPNQAEAEESLPDPLLPSGASEEYEALVERLRTTVAERPDDLQGHMLLARNEANLGNFSAAARAQAQVVRLKGPDATIDDLTDYADMLILAAGGYVSPQAEAVLSTALARDETNGTARYYLGLMLAQTGRPDMAFRMWDRLLREGPPDAPWIAPVLAQIEDMATRAGVTYQIPAIGSSRGPSQDDIAAAGDMTPAERMAMIEGMVGGLSERLAAEGGPVQDWAQLIGALGVLGRTDQAAAIFANALEVFAGDKTALDLLQRAGERAGIAE